MSWARGRTAGGATVPGPRDGSSPRPFLWRSDTVTHGRSCSMGRKPPAMSPSPVCLTVIHTGHRRRDGADERIMELAHEHPAPYRPAQTAASPGMSVGTPVLRVAAGRIDAPGSPATMPFRATNAAISPQSSGSARRCLSFEGELHVERVRSTLNGLGGFHMGNLGSSNTSWHGLCGPTNA